MGLFSSLFGKPAVPERPSSAARLAQICIAIRQESSFLDYYTSNRQETSAALMRLTFSQDVLLILMSTVVLMRYKQTHNQRLMQFNEEVRTLYLRKIPVSPTSIVSDCLICEDELEAIGPVIAPNAPLSQIRTAIVSTTGLISLVVDYRAAEFRRDVLEGITTSPRCQVGFWTPVARTFIARTRGVPRESVADDDVSYMATALILPWGRLIRDPEIDLE